MPALSETFNANLLRSRHGYWQLWTALFALFLALGAVRVSLAQGARAPLSFGPGVLTTIPPDMSPDETVITRDLIEIRRDPSLAWTPQYLPVSQTLHGMSADVKFRREVSCLEFSFKPLRMVEVDVPQASGQIERKLVWYMVYRVRNTGKTLRPMEKEAAAYVPETSEGGPLKFLPQFVLESQDRHPNGARVEIAYLDQLIPAAVEVVRQRELRGQPLLNSVEIGQQLIPVSDEQVDRGVWGVATWVDIDPRIDFFSVFVRGLSNAYRWDDAPQGSPEAFQPGDPPGKGRRFEWKMLQLNFWRPGDELQQTEREIRYGVPIGKAHLYDVPDGVAYRWVYR
jgi:hypothetical protein